jgi:hypothetical protein
MAGQTQFVGELLICRDSQQSRNAHNSQPLVIPRNWRPFRDAKTVPSSDEFPALAQRCHNSVVFRLVSGTTGIRDY